MAVSGLSGWSVDVMQPQALLALLGVPEVVRHNLELAARRRLASLAHGLLHGPRGMTSAAAAAAAGSAMAMRGLPGSCVDRVLARNGGGVPRLHDRGAGARRRRCLALRLRCWRLAAWRRCGRRRASLRLCDWTARQAGLGWGFAALLLLLHGVLRIGVLGLQNLTYNLSFQQKAALQNGLRFQQD